MCVVCSTLCVMIALKVYDDGCMSCNDTDVIKHGLIR
jgi:hypothetical protein